MGMDVVGASLGCPGFTSTTAGILQFPHPSLCCSQLSRLSSTSVSGQCKYSLGRAAVRTLTPSVNIKPTSTSTSTKQPRALVEDASTSATKIVENDPSLAVKKRAAEVSPELKGTSIFLIGMNSSIKSSLGKVLADALRYYYFDSDSLVEEALGGKSVAKSVIERGSRDAETEVLKQLSSMGRLVVCAGNGAVQSATNLALLRHGISIWLDVPLDMVAKDVVEDRVQLLETTMSILGSHSEVLAQLTAIYEKSQSGYATADTTISLQKVASLLGYEDLEEVSAENMALEVLKELEKLMRRKKMMEEAAKPF